MGPDGGARGPRRPQCGLLNCFAGFTARTSPPDARDIAAGPALVHPPLYFEANQGQTDPSVKFVAQDQGYRLFPTATEAVLAFRPGQDGRRDQSSSVRLGLVGARQDVGVEGLELLPG